MILLQDTIAIQTSPEQVFDWLAHFKEYYLAWHPDHVKCLYLKGTSLEVGSVIYVEEYLHGELHRLKLRITKVIPLSRVEYTAVIGMGGAFSVIPHGQGVLFTAETYLGITVPVLASVIDRLFKELFSGRLQALQQHMAEEGVNLKRLLEGRSS
jgi:hypothetical protein